MKTQNHTVFGDQPERAGRTFRFLARKGERALTLIELLVVVAILAILAGLLLPVLARSKARSLAIMCGNNYRQLAFAWTMYSDDNSGNLPYNIGPQANIMSGVNLPEANWINNVMNWETTQGNTNIGFINQSIIGDYTSRNYSVYHCPSDTVLSQSQRQAGWKARVRSTSMNAMVGNPGNYLVNGMNIFDSGYQQFVKETDFKNPASVFVFVEEHPDSIEDGFFYNNAATPEWAHLPASYHNKGGTFSFADGHTEIHRWQSASTLVPNVPFATNFPYTLSATDTADFQWVMKHTSDPLN